jgi:predicted ABC-type ATPase
LASLGTEIIRRVPGKEIEERYERLSAIVAAAITIADRTTAYDNSLAATPSKIAAEFFNGAIVGNAAWPAWAPDELRLLN